MNQTDAEQSGGAERRITRVLKSEVLGRRRVAWVAREDEAMITSADAYRIHSEAWGDEEAYGELPSLANQVRQAIEHGHEDPAHVINYGAILLDLHRDSEALEWLLAHHVEYREYFQNLATAYAKTDPNNKEPIRSNNLKSREYPGCPNAILAYIDYHGL